MEEILQSLDPEQKRAVLSGAFHTLVTAPPGSGKTRVLASRYAHLLKPEKRHSVLALTFTNRAANEMKERVALLTGLKGPDLNVETFHSYCLKYLKRAGAEFTLLSRRDSEEVLAALGVSATVRAAERISAIKNNVIGMEDGDAELFRKYCERTNDLGALDFDDLILRTAGALKSGSRCGIAHLLIDEFQDINPLQSELVRLMAEEGAGVFAIGDPDQAIYGFRGAGPKSFLGFRDDYPGANVINLAVNYRSGGNIVEASKALIKNNRSRGATEVSWTRSGGEISVVECADGDAEARYIVKEIEMLMGGLTSLTVSDAGSGRFSDFAVMYRTNRQARRIEAAFSHSSVPYHRSGADKLREFSICMKGRAVDGPLVDFIEAGAKEFGLDDDGLDSLLESARLFSGAPGEFFDTVIADEHGGADIKADKVTLLTMHSAKGLEFPVVFIAGCEDGLIPLERSDVEEERRLFYVALTRAKERLYMLHASSRDSEAARRSPFIVEIPSGLIKRVTIKERAYKKRPVQKGLFE